MTTAHADASPCVIALINLKGGTAKTTSTAYLAHAYHAAGFRTIVVDADPQQSAMDWHADAAWSMPVLGMATRTVHRDLWGVVPRQQYDIVLLDTPPIEQHGGIVTSVIKVATDLVVPMAPTMMELGRLDAVWHATDDAPDTPAAVLLNRVKPRAASTGVVRSAIEDSGRHVLTAQIGHREAYAAAYGGPVDVTTEYADAAAEILDRK